MSPPSPTPDAEPGHVSETATAAPQARPGRNIPRSCSLCNRRKVRCDRREPCAPCTRAGKPCVYPPSGGRVRRPKKTIMADMASRISSLEMSLNRARSSTTSHASEPRTPASASMHSSPSERPDTVDRRHNDGRDRADILVEKGTSSQYFNDILLSRVIGEERDIQSALATPSSAPGSSPAIVSPFNALGILSAPSSSDLPHSFHPSRHLAVRLWHAYVENVEGCPGVKVLHLPTDEIKVYAAIDCPSAAPPENLSLCFAIYYASLVALPDTEVELMLGQNKRTCLARFKTGMEQALAHADFLDNPTVTGLQVMAIYLDALRVHNRRKGLWILNGLAIRIAQSLGIHRDGERLGLSPFQSEIRRRLWWHFIARDCRAGEDYGLQNTAHYFNITDMNAPLNVEDADLYPDMKELPAPRRGWTSMTSLLINAGVGQAMQKLAALASAASPSNPPKEEERARIMIDVKAFVEERLRDCNPVIPRQRMSINISRFIVRKLDLITRQHWQLLRSPGARTSFATEENLAEALEVLELGCATIIDDMLSSYAWSSRAYPQYHLLLYILWHLCVKPEGPSIERAWRVVNMNSAYLGELSLNGESDALGPKGLVLRALKAKAELIREQVNNAHFATSVGGDRPSATSAGEPIPPDSRSWPYTLPHSGGGDGLGLNINGIEYPAWETLVQEFQLDGENFPNVFWQ